MHRRTVKSLVVLVFLAVGVSWSIDQYIRIPIQIHDEEPSSPATALWTVTAIIDGDTFEVWNGVERQRVRYIGVDAPEAYPKPSECYAKEATEYHETLVLGAQVRLERDVSDTDKYGRWLRYVYIDDTFLNRELVAGGYAYAKMYRPDITQLVALAEAERLAREGRKGLWAACAQE